jgi:hypothetical protein
MMSFELDFDVFPRRHGGEKIAIGPLPAWQMPESMFICVCRASLANRETDYKFTHTKH